MITKISSANLVKNQHLLANKTLLKKAAAPVAGLTGLAILSGASGGPAWQFNEVPPIGVEVKVPKTSVDDGIIESLAYRLEQLVEPLEIPEKLAEAKEVISEHLSNWGDSVIETLSEYI